MTDSLSDKIKEQVKSATVGIFDISGNICGQGVLVAGGYILTAAHCAFLMYNRTDETVRDSACNLCIGELQTRSEYYIGKILLQTGAVCPVRPVFWDPISDIAVFEDLDPQSHNFESIIEKWDVSKLTAPQEQFYRDSGQGTELFFEQLHIAVEEMPYVEISDESIIPHTYDESLLSKTAHELN